MSQFGVVKKGRPYHLGLKVLRQRIINRHKDIAVGNAYQASHLPQGFYSIVRNPRLLIRLCAHRRKVIP
jgi:hypothetical protein